MNKELAEKVFNREKYDELINVLITNIANSVPLGDDESNSEDREKVNALVKKEAIWLLEGDYDGMVQSTSELLDEVYSPEQQQFLLDLYNQHPWILQKGEEYSIVMAPKLAVRTQKLMENLIRNLEDSEEFNHLMESL
jgi:hypothetical protein